MMQYSFGVSRCFNGLLQPGEFSRFSRIEQNPDVHIVQLPYEMTTSYGQGTGEGPKAFIEASAQVELFDVRLGKDLPAGLKFSTVKPWEVTHQPFANN